MFGYRIVAVKRPEITLAMLLDPGRSRFLQGSQVGYPFAEVVFTFGLPDWAGHFF